MQIFGHRGTPGFPRWGENTIQSFRLALQSGADGIEFDVRRCGDGHIVAIHDAWLDRTTNGSGLVARLPYADICRYDAGGGPVPRLTDILDALGGTCLMNIELKETGLSGDVLRIVAERDLSPYTILSSFDRDDARLGGAAWDELAQPTPPLSTALLATRVKVRRLGAGGVVEAARKFEARAIHVSRHAVSDELIRAAHTAGLKVRAYTVNSPKELLRFRDAGVDAVFTDFPGHCRQVLSDAGL